MKKILFLMLVILFSICLYAQEDVFNPDYTYKKFYDGHSYPSIEYLFRPNLSPVPYGYGSWSEDGFGNHRAVVEVSQAAPCVLANVEWRRYDLNPEQKQVLVYNENNEKVNSKVFEINKIFGKIVFEAKNPGKYYIYYMPYEGSKAYNIEKSVYFPIKCEASEEWLNANKLNGNNIPNMPQAKLIQIENRGEHSASGNDYIPPSADFSKEDFYSMYPMLITISDEEKASFDNSYNGRDFLLFCEDRTNHIKMTNQIPYKWFKEGERKVFLGNGRPNEIYAFQIGVYALKDLKNLKLFISDFTNGIDTIKASDIHCLNLGGNDFLGDPFTKTVNLNKGNVEPLWFYMTLPKSTGDYKGTITVSFDNSENVAAEYTITVAGSELSDGGVSDTWRMSRISWFDSKLGLEDTVVPPYTPIKINGNKASILNREIEFSELGFINQVKVKGVNLYAKPLEFSLYENGKKLELKPISKNIIKSTDANYIVEYISGNDKVQLNATFNLDFTGKITYSVRLNALKDIDLSNVTLESPLNKDIAQYALGFALRGGKAPYKWNWSWSNYIDYMCWLGNHKAGMQLRLDINDLSYRFGGTFDSKLRPIGWYNDNKGGVDLISEKNDYMCRAYSGERKFKAGDICHYNFRIMLTPFKDFDMKGTDWRWGFSSIKGANTFYTFHGQPGNCFINYPMLETDYLQKIHHNEDYLDGNFGKIRYDVKNLNLSCGSVTMWVKVPYDLNRFHRDQFAVLNFAGNKRLCLEYYQDCLQFVPCIGDNYNRYGYFQRFKTSAKGWKAGENHAITLAWNGGDNNSVFVIVDNELVLREQAPFKLENIPSDFLDLNGWLLYDTIRMDTQSTFNQEKKTFDYTVLYDTFENKESSLVNNIQRDVIPGDCLFVSDYDNLKELHLEKLNHDIYFASRELSNHCAEMFVMKALKNEIFNIEGIIFDANGAKQNKVTGGGYQWLNEQLQDGYIPQWHMKLSNGEHCASVAVRTDGRWMNYYTAICDYLAGKFDNLGIYLDGIGCTGETTKRNARVFTNHYGNYRINFHGPNNYDYENWKSNCFSAIMEHLPYMEHNWTGEGFTFGHDPDYWFVEFSGIPFGVNGEMLEYQNGGNPYRGMLYGMTGRQLENYTDMLAFWDNWGLNKSEMIGYWVDKPIVKVISPDNTDIYAKKGDILAPSPKTVATVYKQKGTAIIALATWETKDINVKLDIDWKALGMNKDKVKISIPPIIGFQLSNDSVDLNNLPIKAEKGCIIQIDEIKM